jgi:hypothetical protein
VRDEFSIDYAGGLASLAAQPYDAVVQAIRDEMPQAWLVRYQAMCNAPTNALVVAASGFDYLFDYCSELIARGELPPDAREDRTVVAFGVSTKPARARNASRMRGFPASYERGDRGHFMAHAAGGGLDINLFHQNARLNRGWSPEGRRYREMEQYVASHEGTLFFSRPIYEDHTARPAQIEFGVLRHDVSFWVELFDNPSL